MHVAKSKVSHSGHVLVLTAKRNGLCAHQIVERKKRKQKGVCEQPNKGDTADWPEGAVVRRPLTRVSFTFV